MRTLSKSLPLLIAVPHSSGHVPQDIIQKMIGVDALDVTKKQAFLDYIFLQGDPYTEQLFWVEGAYHLEASASRFVIDINRVRDDDSANGVIKQHDFAERPLYLSSYQPDAAEKQRRFTEFYDPFHKRYRELLAQVDFYIDVHSMMATGPVMSPDSNQQRPAFCLMTERSAPAKGRTHNIKEASVPEEIAQALKTGIEKHFSDLLEEELLAGHSAQVCLNNPWPHAGIGAFYDDHDTLGIGLEINRAMYMDGAKVRPERVLRINQAFQAFALDTLELVQQYKVKR